MCACVCGLCDVMLATHEGTYDIPLCKRNEKLKQEIKNKKIELSKRVIISKSNLTGCFTTLPVLVVYELSDVVLISGSWVGELLVSSHV